MSDVLYCYPGSNVLKNKMGIQDMEREELREVDGGYFEVLQAGGFVVTLRSRNTGHYWHLLEREYPTFRHFAIYHKHNASDGYHAQGTARDLAAAVSGIRSYDEFRLNGRKKV